MTTAGARLRAVAKWSAVPIGLLVGVGMVWQSSYAGFSSSTTTVNNWTAGTVGLLDDDNDTAMFTASTLVPGSTGSKCIKVTSEGSENATVKLYGTGAAATNSLDTYLDLVVQQGSGGSFDGGCTGFVADGAPNFTGTLASFASTYTNFGNGFGSFTPVPGTVTKVYKIQYTLSASTPSSAQGSTASLGLTWESRNN